MLKLIDLIVNKIKRRNKWIAMDFWFREASITAVAFGLYHGNVS